MPRQSAKAGSTTGEETLPVAGCTTALALSGGNALGAYRAGAYQALHERNIEPDWIVGASAGAINAAIICGNSPAERLKRLRQLWTPAVDAGLPCPSGGFEDARRAGAAMWTMMAGRAGLFTPRHLAGPWWNPFGNREPASLYDTTPMCETLEQLVDFERLNRGVPRFSATAVDLETGEDLVFDTDSDCIGTNHLRASAALLPAFSPVEVDGRLLGDAGISANLPLDPILTECGNAPMLCIAIDLLPLGGPRPTTLGETAIRMQDLIFATQSRRFIAQWQALFDERGRHSVIPSVTLLHLAYSDDRREVSGKAFDFSPQSAAFRWQAGYSDLIKALDLLSVQSLAKSGLSVFRLSSDRTQLEDGRNALSAPAAGGR